MKSEHLLRCFCEIAPVLGTYGVDDSGRLYVHVIIRKGSDIQGEVVVRGGEVVLKCRVCNKWHTVKMIESNKMALQEAMPPSLSRAV